MKEEVVGVGVVVVVVAEEEVVEKERRRWFEKMLPPGQPLEY